MSIFIGNSPRWATLIRKGVGLAVMLLLGGANVVGAQAGTPLLQVLDVKRSTMQQQVSSLAEAGYAIAFARLDPGLLIAQKGPVAGRRSYLFAEDLGTFLKDKLERGYRLLPQTFSPGGKPFCAVFEKVEGDDRLREYTILTASTPGDLEKKARTTLVNEFVPVAVYAMNGVAAVFERKPEAASWKLLSTRKSSTMEKELAAAAAEGFRVVASSGGEEIVYALVRPPDAQPLEYRMVTTTKSTTLEKELNEAAAQGWRLVPFSLAGVAGDSSMALLGGRISNEAAIVIEKDPASRPVSYKVVGARRVSTIEKELLAVAAHGFTIAAVVLGYEETVVILASPNQVTTTAG